MDFDEMEPLQDFAVGPTRCRSVLAALAGWVAVIVAAGTIAWLVTR